MQRRQGVGGPTGPPENGLITRYAYHLLALDRGVKARSEKLRQQSRGRQVAAIVILVSYERPTAQPCTRLTSICASTSSPCRN